MKKKFAAALCTLSILIAAFAAVSPLVAADAATDPASGRSSGASASAWPRESARLAGRFILWTGSDKTYVAVPAVGTGGDLATTAWPTESAAHLKAASWNFPAPGTTGPVSRADKCLRVGAAGSRVVAVTCDGSASQQLRLAQVAGGWAIRSVSTPDSYVDFDKGTSRLRAFRVANADTLRMNQLSPVSYSDISVSTVTPGAAGEATITGKATIGASIVLGENVVEASRNGLWTMTVTGIPVTGATLTIRQSIGGVGYGSARAVVPAWPEAPEPPTATVTFDEDVHKNAVLSGTGAEGAVVSVRAGENEIATAPVEAGAWSTEIDALGAGAHELEVSQSLGGLESAPTSLTVDYGAAIAVTTPVDGAVVPPGGTVDFTGRGEPGSLIKVRPEEDGAAVLTTTVRPDGTWSITDVVVD